MISKDMKRFNHLIGEIEAVYHEISWKQGLSDSVFEVLYTICNYGDSCMLKDICHNCGLRKLEKEGIVYLESVDSRHKKVCLTEAGKSLAGRTAGAVIEAENEILASWSKEEVETYIALTRRYLLALQNKAKNLPEASERRMT